MDLLTSPTISGQCDRFDFSLAFESIDESYYCLSVVYVDNIRYGKIRFMRCKAQLLKA